jgi:hypothetical protein
MPIQVAEQSARTEAKVAWRIQVAGRRFIASQAIVRSVIMAPGFALLLFAMLSGDQSLGRPPSTVFPQRSVAVQIVSETNLPPIPSLKAIEGTSDQPFAAAMK